jgi:hypothetical protein
MFLFCVVAGSKTTATLLKMNALPAGVHLSIDHWRINQQTARRMVGSQFDSRRTGLAIRSISSGPPFFRQQGVPQNGDFPHGEFQERIFLCKPYFDYCNFYEKMNEIA